MNILKDFLPQLAPTRDNQINFLFIIFFQRDRITLSTKNNGTGNFKVNKWSPDFFFRVIFNFFF